MSNEEEMAFLAPFFDKKARCGTLAVSEIKEALDARLGRKTPLTTVYNLLHRHNWQKQVVGKHHLPSEVGLQSA